MKYKFLNKFILRIPLFPFDFYFYKKGLNDKIFHESLMLASKDFYKIQKTSCSSERVLKTMYKYYSRACSRATPFGLFASCSIGEISSDTKCVINSDIEKSFCRKTRLNLDFISKLIEYFISKSSCLREELLFYPNDCIYKVGDEYRFVEYYYIESERKHQIVSLSCDLYLDIILKEGKNGLKISEYRKLLCNMNVDYSEAKRYVDDLISSQFLRCELGVNITGKENLENLISILEKFDLKNEHLSTLYNIRFYLSKIDFTIIKENFYFYEKLVQELNKFDIQFDHNSIFHCDLLRKGDDVKISKDILRKIYAGVSFLNKITKSKQKTHLNDFISEFYKRYNEGEMVSLLKFMDSDIGYLYKKKNIIYSELIGSVYFPSDQTNKNRTIDFQEEIILKKIIDSLIDKKESVELTEEDFSSFKENWTDLPATFSVLTRIIDKDNIYLEVAGGSSAANNISRFAYLDSDIESLTRVVTEKEEKIFNDAIVAEIIHFPSERAGNILLRPILRKYELHYLCQSQTKKEFQIAISDLDVTVINDEIILYSRVLNKRIIPKLTCAHNYMYDSLPIYHFLGDLQTQNNRSSFLLNIDGIFNILDEIPQIRFKKCILSKHKWKIEARLLVKWSIIEEENIIGTVQIWRKERKIPRFVTFSEGDNELLLDFESIVSIKTLLSYSKKYPFFYIEEFLFSGEASFVSDNNGNKFSNEFIFFLCKE